MDAHRRRSGCIPALSRLDFKFLNCLTGISVYVTDMVELTDKIAATLVHGGDGAVAVMDAGVVEMREEVTRAVEGYAAAAEEGGGGVGVKRMVAVATMNNMHQDVCILAEDLMVSLIVMPFHKEEQAEDGRLGVGHSGFRHVNRKVRDESFGNSLFFTGYAVVSTCLQIGYCVAHSPRASVRPKA